MTDAVVHAPKVKRFVLTSLFGLIYCLLHLGIACQTNQYFERSSNS